MGTIAILPEHGEDNQTTFTAVTSERKATGRTAGEALDALTSQLGAEGIGMPVIVQQFLPDEFFTAAQQERLSTLMARWRAARDTQATLSPAEQTELERLVDEEAQASANRTLHILHGLETSQVRRSSEERLVKARLLQKLKRQRVFIFYIRILVAASLLAQMLIILYFISIYRDKFNVIGLLTLSIISIILQALSLFFYDEYKTRMHKFIVHHFRRRKSDEQEGQQKAL